MTHGDSWYEPQVEAGRYILTEASRYLSERRIEQANELLDAEEPTQALLGIAWELGRYRDQLPEQVVRLLKEEVGDTAGVHPAFRQ